MDEKIVICLMGRARSGKSTAAEYLHTTYGASDLHISDPIKKITQNMFNFSNDQVWGERKEEVDSRWGHTPRKFMQDLGLYGRKFLGDNVWLDTVLASINDSNDDLFVIDDIRYESTIDYLRSLDDFSTSTRYVLVKLVYEDRQTTDDGNHPSEAGIDLIPEYKFDEIIKHRYSEKQIDLKDSLDDLVDEYYWVVDSNETT